MQGNLMFFRKLDDDICRNRPEVNQRVVSSPALGKRDYNTHSYIYIISYNHNPSNDSIISYFQAISDSLQYHEVLNILPLHTAYVQCAYICNSMTMFHACLSPLDLGKTSTINYNNMFFYLPWPFMALQNEKHCLPNNGAIEKFHESFRANHDAKNTLTVYVCTTSSS